MEQNRTTTSKQTNWMLRHPLVRKYFPLVHEDLTATYSRDLHKWLIIAPIIGVTTGLAITAIATIILGRMWPPVLAYYLAHHWAILPGLVGGFALTGLIMQFLTPDPDEHSTEEIIRSYHEHQGYINLRPFFPKLLAAITTVGFGGSAALEGPSIYGGAAIGSWLWARLRLKLTARDRRIMLICGAAAGMSAVFHAPLTGIVFALEMPYKDDLAHEALVPSLIASVISYVTLSAFLGGAPLFNFASGSGFTGKDLFWCALLGLMVGAIAMAFVITFPALDKADYWRFFNCNLRPDLPSLFPWLACAYRTQLRSGRNDPKHPSQYGRASSLQSTQARRYYIYASGWRRQRDVRSALSYWRQPWCCLRPVCSPQLFTRSLCRRRHGVIYLGRLQNASGRSGIRR
jgi:H+/Cl- antiporter ClcA